METPLAATIVCAESGTNKVTYYTWTCPYCQATNTWKTKRTTGTINIGCGDCDRLVILDKDKI